MDHSTRRFIGVTRQLLTLLKKLRKDSRKTLTSLGIDLHDIKNFIHAIDKNTRPGDNKEDSKKEIVAVLHTPETVETKRQSEAKGQKGRDRIRLLVEWLTLFAVTFYGYMAVRQWREMISLRHQTQGAIEAAARSANAADTANVNAERRFAQEQRPYVWITNDIGPFKVGPLEVGGKPKLQFNYHFTNYGKSPAIRCESKGRILFGRNARKRITIPLLDATAGGILAPGVDNFNTAWSDEIVTDPDILKKVGFNEYVTISGYIQYSDRAGNPYSSEFCFEFVPGLAMSHCVDHNSIK